MQLNEDIVETNKRLEAEGATEEQVIAAAQEAGQDDALNTPELNEAAAQFMSTVPKIKALASNLSRNGLARVFKAVVEFPLAESYPRFKGVEQELFVLTLNALSAKTVMTNAFMTQSGDQIKNDAEDGVVESLKEEMNG